MQIEIDFVDAVILQNILNVTFGSNVFTVVLDKSTGIRIFYLEYNSETTSQQQIDEALTLANQHAQTFLNEVKLYLFEKMNGKVQKLIAKKEKPIYTEIEIQQASYWLQNQSTPVPACVLYLSLAKSISNIDAAQLIVNSQASYDNYINEILNLKIQIQNQIMVATSTYDAKQIATSGIEQIKNVT